MKNEEAVVTLSAVAAGLDMKMPGAETAYESLTMGVDALKKQIPMGFIQKDLFVVCPPVQKISAAHQTLLGVWTSVDGSIRRAGGKIT